MKRIVAILGVAATFAGEVGADGDLVTFPANYAEGVVYAVVPRGNIKQELYTSREAIDAVKRGGPIPSGTVITLVDYRDRKLFRYVVMDKRTGWGAEYSSEKRNREWEYRQVGEPQREPRSLLLLP